MRFKDISKSKNLRYGLIKNSISEYLKGGKGNYGKAKLRANNKQFKVGC